VTVKNVDPAKDAMLLISYQLQPSADNNDAVSPTVIDFRMFSMTELIIARDKRLTDAGGRWFGNYETPCVISEAGRAKVAARKPLDTTTYGRKESEGRDFNEDTNFGKLKRIPHVSLQSFIKECQALSLGVSVEQVEKIPELPEEASTQSLIDLFEEKKKEQ